MSLTASTLMARARALLNDGPGNNYATDEISDQVDGANLRLKAFNQNLLKIADGAPKDPEIRLGAGTVQAYTALDQPTGTFTLAAAIPAGTFTRLEYFFQLMTDAEYLGFVAQAQAFVGVTKAVTTPADDTTITELLGDGAAQYMAHLGATKMSNLASWYYTANAGNKSFNKDAIAAKFKEMAKELLTGAVRARDDVYKRQGQRNAPAYATANIPLPSYTPPR